MIRVGFLRFEIEAVDECHPEDLYSRQVRFYARPTYRGVRIKWSERSNVEAQFAQGQATYGQVLQQAVKMVSTSDISIPDVGPHVWRYSKSDKEEMINYWMVKLQKQANAFAYEVVRTATKFPQLVISNPVIRANYARMVEHEIMRVIDGKSVPQPTNTEEPMEIDVTQNQKGIPELVAAELVRDVFEANHFKEFCSKDYVTIKNGGKKYRISRRTHALIDVWDEEGKPLNRLCVVFKDPGMPPSDEVVMKYLLVKHHLEDLNKIAVVFPAIAKQFAD